MKIVLYSSHNCLPFSLYPSDPDGLFDPNILEGWTCSEEWDEVKKCSAKKPAREHPMIPVLEGLHALELPGAMAHVSIIFDPINKTVNWAKRSWVQITTETGELDKRGIPVIVRDGKVQVSCLWCCDRTIYSPYELLDEASRAHANTPEFWTDFFLGMLRAETKKARDKAEEAKCEAEKYARILK